MGFINWGTGGFAIDDWQILYNTIKQRNVKSVLEYGCGVSTELLMLLGLDILSLESRKEYMPIPCASAFLYQYPDFPILDRRFDLAFIDGPGAEEFERARLVPERRYSAFHAMRYTNLILLHDGGLGQIEPLMAAGWRQDPPGYNGVGARMILFVKDA